MIDDSAFVLHFFHGADCPFQMHRPHTQTKSELITKYTEEEEEEIEIEYNSREWFETRKL